MKVLLDERRVFVTYGSASVVRADREPGDDDFAVETDEPVELFDADAYGDALDAAWADGRNGLCGAGVPGILELQTGTHTGWLPFRVELHDMAPPVDGSWEEVVEVSFTADSGQLALAGLGGDFVEFTLPPRDYRVRYCIRGLDAADTVQQPPDEYLLQFWPAAAAAGQIVQQTAERAAYWHRARRPGTEQDLADAAWAEQDEREKPARDRWGERTPNARLQATLGAGLYLSTISALDPELEFALADVDDEVHRQVAAWAVLRSLTMAGLVDRPQLAPAVTALRRGVLVEAPFDDSGYVWSLLERMKPPRTSVPTPPDGQDQQSPQDWAISSVFHSAMSDSLAGVLEVLVCLAFVSGRDGYRQAYAEVRQQFPQLTR